MYISLPEKQLLENDFSEVFHGGSLKILKEDH